MKNRNTMQRQLVLSTVQRMQNHPTADAVFQAIAVENAFVSKATVYRNLKSLAQNGEILHIPIPNGADRFDFNTVPHYHMFCRACEGVFDVEIPYQMDFCAKINNQNGFLIESYLLVFQGLCPACRASVHSAETERSIS